MTTQVSKFDLPDRQPRWLTLWLALSLFSFGCEAKCRNGYVLEAGVCRSANPSDTAMAQATVADAGGKTPSEPTTGTPVRTMGAGAAGLGGQQAGARSMMAAAPQASDKRQHVDGGTTTVQPQSDGGSSPNATGTPATMPMACPGGAEPADETCDNTDEDCDGQVDENVTQACGSSARSPCQLGMQVCTAGEWGACSGAIEPADEICDPDQIDENCDGNINEGCDCVPGEAMACGVTKGQCREGVQQCASDGKFEAVCRGEVGPKPEQCDGRADEDCDGLEDTDDPDCACINGQTQSCQATGIGVCSQGEQTCANGKWGRCTGKQVGCVCDDKQPARDCGSSSKGTCRLGKQRCSQGQWSSACEGEVKPTTESCDGTDTDCDGVADAMDSDAQRSCGSGNTCDGTRCASTAPPTAPGRALRNGKSSLCLGIAGASTASGAAAGQYNCDSNANQRWEERAAGGNVNLINKKSSLCLGVSGGSTADGAEIAQFSCDPASPANNQAWRLNSLGSGFFQLVNGKSGKCIGVSGGSTANGAAIMQFPCETNGTINNQSWTYVD